MIRKGTPVRWQWGGATAYGKIAERFDEKVTRTIAGTKITRNATPDDPAYLIVQDDGGEVLKSASEIERDD